MTSLNPSTLPVPYTKPHESRGHPVIHHRTSASPLHIGAIPDLRFERGYLRSIAPYVHVPQPYTAPDGMNGADGGVAGNTVLVEWKSVAWITIRDQVLSPLIQGAVWGFASQFLVPVIGLVKARLFSQRLPKLSASFKPRQSEGSLTDRLRAFSKSLDV